MRLRNAIGFAVLGALLVSGCSRLTFVKPNASRGDYTQVAPEYTFKGDPASDRRYAAAAHVLSAQQYLGAGQLDKSAAEARAALKIDSSSAAAYTLLGAIEERQGRNAEAGTQYARAAELEPERGTALNNYGAWLCSNGRAAESLPLFDRALQDPTYPTPAAALANAGSCAMITSELARAERYLRAALSMDPVNPVALAAMAEHEYRTGRYLDARAFSQRRLAAAPSAPAVLVLASQIEKKLGDTAAADRYVQQLRTEFPQAPTVPPGEGSQR